MPDHKLSEILILCDENPALGAAEGQDGLIRSARIGFEHMMDVMSRCSKRGSQARLATLVEQELHGSASTTASSAR
jgi:hypothetical protein